MSYLEQMHILRRGAVDEAQAALALLADARRSVAMEGSPSQESHSERCLRRAQAHALTSLACGKAAELISRSIREEW